MRSLRYPFPSERGVAIEGPFVLFKTTQGGEGETLIGSHDVEIWQKGYLSGVDLCPSPNWDERPADTKVCLLVLHSISLPSGEYGGGNIERFFANKLDFNAHRSFNEIRDLRVSTHFFIDRLGKLTQFVSCDKRAWHAGRSSWNEKINCNDYSIGIELEGTDYSFFEEIQYVSLRSLCTKICKRYPIQACVGHSHVALPRGRKTDPGIGFKWQNLSLAPHISVPI